MATPSAVAANTNSAAQFRINGYRLVSVSQVPGTPANKPLFDYVYKVDVLNGGSAAGRVTATADTHGKALTLLDRDVSFGIVAPGETKTSIDTITVRAKRNFDRSLDARTQKNGIWTFVEPGPMRTTPVSSAPSTTGPTPRSSSITTPSLRPCCSGPSW